MYKSNRNRQLSLSDFNQPTGLKMNPENRWIKRTEMIPWAEIEENIRISGPALGRPKKFSKEEKLQAYNDNTDRIEVERGFSLAKRCYGMGLIRTKLDTTTRSSIALSILAMNINHRVAVHLWLFLISMFSRYFWQKKLPKKAVFSYSF